MKDPAKQESYVSLRAAGKTEITVGPGVVCHLRTAKYDQFTGVKLEDTVETTTAANVQEQLDAIDAQLACLNARRAGVVALLDDIAVATALPSKELP